MSDYVHPVMEDLVRRCYARLDIRNQRYHSTVHYSIRLGMSGRVHLRTPFLHFIPVTMLNFFLIQNIIGTFEGWADKAMRGE